MTSPLRILHVAVSDRFAGVEQFILRLATQQASDGHAVWVAGGDPAMMAEPLREAGVRYAPVASAVHAVRAVRSVDVDVINTHMTEADLVAVTARVLDRRGPAIVSTRHFALRRGSRGPSAIYRAIERSLDAEIAISHAVASSIDAPSTIVYSGVDAPPSASVRRTRTVLMAQRLEEEKQTGTGIRAFAASGIAANGWRLDVAGDGAQRDDLEALAQQLGVAEQVSFLGFRADIPARMQSASLMLAPTPNEGLGLAVLEAMAAGLPVIAADAGGHSDLLADVDGAGLFRPGDSADAAAQLRRLAGDKRARRRLGRAQQARQLAYFTLRAQADGTEAVYRDAIDRRRHG